MLYSGSVDHGGADCGCDVVDGVGDAVDED